MDRPRKSRLAFRPSLADATLEDRLVLTTLAASRIAVPLDARGVRTPRYAIVLKLPASPFAQRHNANLTASQIRAAYIRQFRAAAADLRTAINTAAAQLYATGNPTPQQLATFNAQIAGAINATAFRLSGQAALLPGSSSRLLPSIQGALLGSTPSSLVNRLVSITQSNRFTASTQSLQQAIAQQLNRTSLGTNAQIANFFATTPVNRLSVDQNGQRIPLQQFMANQVVTQFRNTLGSLAQSFPTVANSMLFANGVTTPTTAAQMAFLNQTNQALGVAAFQLANNLALFPNATTGIIPQLQSAFFGTTPSSLIGALQSLQFGGPGFATAANSAFNSGFQNALTPLNSALGLTPAQNEALAVGQLPGIFAPPFLSFASGFNNGFGSGFPGFGAAPTTFNPAFSTGFNSLVGGFNGNVGFNPPNFTSFIPGTTTGGFGPGTGILFATQFGAPSPFPGNAILPGFGVAGNGLTAF